MEKVKNKVYSTDKNSIEYLEINSCGVEHIYKRDRGSNRPEGRKDYHLIYVEKGVLHVFIDGKWQSHLAGSVVLFRPFEPQNYYYLEKDNSISHFVHFSGVGCETILKRLGIYDLKVFMMGQSSHFKEISSRMAQEFAMRKPMYKDWCAAYFYQLLSITARKYALRQSNVNRKSEIRINEACRIIYENIQEPPTAEELAKEFSLSISRFLHLFREVSGQSYTEFLTSLRMEKARDILLSTNMSVKDIAEYVGIYDQNYFSRCFRKNVGMSPSEYRKQGIE
ncbi:MAG: helix-turn-helix transcriptional regulator [Clostridia bacterium]|nr:helix-turn-helix transcriptional regulator [Clostridia bacterium]